MIIAPLDQADETRSRCDRQGPRETSMAPGFRTAYVFDVEQTEGRPLPAFATTGDPRDYGEKLKAFVARQGIALEYRPAIAPAQGLSSGGRIRLLPKLSPAEEFSALAHELAHEMLHHGQGRATCPRSSARPRRRPSLLWSVAVLASRPARLPPTTSRCITAMPRRLRNRCRRFRKPRLEF